MKILVAKSKAGKWSVLKGNTKEQKDRLSVIFDKLDIHPDVVEVHLAEVKITSKTITPVFDIDVSDL